MKIVVLAGGLSPERDVSLTSGAMICNTLRDLGHEAILLDIFLGHPGDPKDLADLFVMDGSYVEKPKILSTEPDIAAVRAMREDKSLSELGPNVIELCRMADICYMGLHGGIGENGMLQATLDVLGVRYTGANSLSSALAMHKGVAKEILSTWDIPLAKGHILHPRDLGKPLSDLGMNFPVVVKVCSGGSSIGVYMADDEATYQEALKLCFAMERDVLVEERIIGREFAAPVVAGKALPVIEIVPKGGWFDYAHKYQDGLTEEICPADIPPEIEKKMQEEALKACKALGVEVYARPDFMLDSDGNIYCIEVNTLPGMTPASLLPKCALVAGMSYPDLCQTIIDESNRRYEESL